MTLNRKTGSSQIDDAGVLMKKGQIADAQALLKRHLASNPGDAKAEYLWGISKLREGDAPAAEKTFRKVLGQMPENYGAAFSLGLALEQRGQVEEAIEAYQVAILLKPDYGPARAKLVSHGRSIAETAGLRKQRTSTRQHIQARTGSKKPVSELPMNEFYLPMNDTECAEYKKRYAAKITAKYKANRDLLLYLLDNEIPKLTKKITETESRRVLTKGGNDVLFQEVSNLLRLLRA